MTNRAHRRGRRGLLFAGVGLAASAIVGAAFAFWASTDSSNPAAAVADSIQAGNTPTLGGINGQDVALNWAATSTAAGSSVTGYTISRYSVSSGGTPTAATGGCSGTVTALTCTEQSAPAGTWYYAVTPTISLWTGAESGRLSVPVVAASFSVTVGQQLKTPGTVAGGSISHFKNGETVTFHLDSAGGTTLTGSVSAVNGSGAASGFTVTIPSGPAEGNHTIVAVGGSGSQATSNSFNVDNTAPVTTDNSASIGSGWFNVTQTVTLTPTDSGGSGVAATYYTTDGSTPTTSSTQGTSVGLSNDGVYTLKYFSVDNAGNTEAVKTAGTAIHIDKTIPTPATLSIPSFIKNGQVLTNAATDPTVNGASSGVSSVSYYYCFGTGCTPSTLIGTSSTGPNYSVAWSAQPADGTYQVRAVVTDVAGNTANSTTVSTLIDNTPPSNGSVSITGGYYTSASVSVTFTTGTDTGGSNIASRQLQRASATLLGGSCGSFASPVFTNVGPANPTSSYADTSVVSGNCYEYQYLVTDGAGNTTPYGPTVVAKIDTTAPAFTVASTGTNVYWNGSVVLFHNGAGTSGSFTVTATDPESGIGTPTFGSAPSGWTVSGSGSARTYTLTSTSAAGSITVSATNGAGTNTGNQTITLTLDNTKPAPVDVTLANGIGTPGTADTGDTDTITYSEQLNASSICSAWTNSGLQTLTNATVTLTNSGGKDLLSVATASCSFNFGSQQVGDYVSANASFTSSTVAWDPTAKTLTITLGTTASGALKTGVATFKQVYTPVAAITDLVGNTMATTAFTDTTATGF
jgi:hypothetical protein